MDDFPKRIRMTETKLGAIDGNTIAQYVKDTEYDDLGDLARTFVKAGWAEVVELKATSPVELATPTLSDAETKPPMRVRSRSGK